MQALMFEAESKIRTRMGHWRVDGVRGRYFGAKKPVMNGQRKLKDPERGDAQPALRKWVPRVR